jgi:hypothetical protein
MIDNKKFMIAGIIIALLIGVIAVFIASKDPDGLESTALVCRDKKQLLVERWEMHRSMKRRRGGHHFYV